MMISITAKSWLQIALGLFLLVLPMEFAHAQHRVLFIGNSFTIGSGGGGVPGIFDRLAQAGGHPDPTTVMRAVGGQNFQFHSQDATTQATINSQPWTHVVLQNYSTEPTHLASGSVANHYTYGSLLYRQIMTNHPQTQVVLFETWSRAPAHSLITGVSSPSGFASTAEFQTELRTNYQGLADALNASYPTNPPVVVAPVGTAWENTGGLLPAADPFFVPLFGSDDYHGNNNGYYLAACVIYSKIYGVSAHGLSTNSLVSSLNLGLTVSPTLLEDFAWATVSGSSQTGLQSFLFDFGPASATTTNGPAPNDPANHWNNITEAIGATPTGALSNIVTTANAATDISLVMVSRFNGANENGSTTATAFPVNATRDSLYGNTEAFNGLSEVFPSFKFVNLNPARTYSFTFYAARVGVGDNRETGYTVTGENSGFAALNAANNTDATALVAGITPDASGAITISLAPTANNNNANHFTYLSALRLDAVPQQEPIVFLQHPASQTVSEFMPAQFVAAVQGTPPYFIQWFSNDVAIPDANQFTYTVPSVTTNMDGAVFAVSVSNLVYGATSSNAVLHVTPVTGNPAAQALFFDFGASTTPTANGVSPNDPLNLWNNVTTAVGSSATGRLTNLVTAANAPTTIGLMMLSRFNGANENGTMNWPLLPQNATRDSLFGNTEMFSGLANVFPSFKLVGLDPDAKYDLTFYASRTGVGDNRETGYTVTGANSGFAALNAANNVTNTARVTGILPDAAREITISLAPTANNNNANHFTYLGVLRLDAVLPPEFLPATLTEGQLRLDWTGEGQLEWAPAITGPWTPITPRPSPPYSEEIVPGQDRFFRLLITP